MNSISAKNSRFSLTLALILLLTLTFVFSLRAVRLKIGDYYFNQGNFDQAVNWNKTQSTQQTLLIHLPFTLSINIKINDPNVFVI
jgi:hypothetical protein